MPFSIVVFVWIPTFGGIRLRFYRLRIFSYSMLPEKTKKFKDGDREASIILATLLELRRFTSSLKTLKKLLHVV